MSQHRSSLSVQVSAISLSMRLFNLYKLGDPMLLGQAPRATHVVTIEKRGNQVISNTSLECNQSVSGIKAHVL